MQTPRTCARTRALALGLGLALTATLTLPASAQHAPKHAVVIDTGSQDGDLLGQLLVSDFRDDVARSPRWYEAPSEIQPFGTSLTIHLVTVKEGDGTQGTSVAETLTVNGYYLETFELSCGKNAIAQCAKEIMPDLDAAIDKMQQALQQGK
jgi:hypothetical protein